MLFSLSHCSHNQCAYVKYSFFFAVDFFVTSHIEGKKHRLWQHKYFTSSFVMLSEKEKKMPKQICLFVVVIALRASVCMCRFQKCWIYNQHRVIALCLYYVNMHVLELMYSMAHKRSAWNPHTVPFLFVRTSNIHCAFTTNTAFSFCLFVILHFVFVCMLNLYSIYENICVNSFGEKRQKWNTKKTRRKFSLLAKIISRTKHDFTFSLSLSSSFPLSRTYQSLAKWHSDDFVYCWQDFNSVYFRLLYFLALEFHHLLDIIFLEMLLFFLFPEIS